MLSFQKRKGTVNPGPIFNISQARCKPETSFYDLHLGGLPEPMQPFATEADADKTLIFFELQKSQPISRLLCLRQQDSRY